MKKKEQRPEDFRIDKGLAIPPKAGGGRPRIYPFDEMRVGESFFIKGKSPGHISGSRNQAQKRTGFVFVLRTVKGGVRAWRTK